MGKVKLINQQTDKLNQQRKNWENHNGAELVHMQAMWYLLEILNIFDTKYRLTIRSHISLLVEFSRVSTVTEINDNYTNRYWIILTCWNFLIFFLLETETKDVNIAQVRCYSNTGDLMLSRKVVFNDQSSIRALLPSSTNHTDWVLVSTFTSIAVNCGFGLRIGKNQRLLNATSWHQMWRSRHSWKKRSAKQQTLTNSFISDLC